MKKLLLLLILIMPTSVFALETNAKSSVLIETSSMTILSEQAKDIELPPASMTNVMETKL